MSQPSTNLSDMNERSREVFRLIVESYLDTGEPVGSRTLTRAMSESVSPATVRNTMQDLEFLGLLASPHISAGRIPTELGLRLFVDGIMQIGDITETERAEIERGLDDDADGIPAMLDRAGSLLSGLTRSASLVLVPRTEAEIKHIEFISLSPDRALVVLVTADGQVENRLFAPPKGITPSALREAANFLNAILAGKSVSDLRQTVQAEIETHRRELDRLAAELVEQGLAVWADKEGDDVDRLIVRGRSNLIGPEARQEDLDRIRELFDDLERKRDVAQLIDLTEQGEGVRIFIGSENKLFSLSGSSLVVSPYMNAERKIIGAVGVIGPTRQNYGRIVPIVDYTAQLVGRMISRGSMR